MSAIMSPADDSLTPFHKLAPEVILDAVESTGLRCSGHISALNSYENRVYQIGIEDELPVIAKFYRPNRWTDDAIMEEHELTATLAEYEIPVIAPLVREGLTLFHSGPFRFALYPRVGGRAPELDDPEHLVQLGRCIARIHNVGAIAPFKHRPRIDIDSFVIQPREFLIQHGFIPTDLTASYDALMEAVIRSLEGHMRIYNDVVQLRLHGDSHVGNILWYDNTPSLVDFDDARMGPAVQDLWMLLSGDREYMCARLHDLLDGYCEFREFDARELYLIESLRTMRMVHHAGWLAQRWDDPAFPGAFPWFNTQRYWEEHILYLKEQLSMMEEPPLEWQAD
jgi:Ser/Thr protein kinase RdoA (MazF antagonist)